MNSVIIAHTIAITALIIALFVVMRQRDRAWDQAGRVAALALMLHRALMRAQHNLLWYRGTWHN